MGTLVILSPEDPDSPFGDLSMFDACVDPQYNGVFPDDPGLGIVSERKANVRVPADPRATDNPRRGQDHKTEFND
jgi:hypothetical protein